MSIKDWKDKELNGLLNERWGFSMDLSKLNESKKKPDADGDGVPDWADKKDGKDDHAEDKPKKKAKKGEIPPQLKQHVKGKKENINEGESELEEIKAMVRQNFEGEELDDATINQIANMIKQKRDKNKPPPSNSSGNDSSGAPAQPSMQERKLRKPIRR